MPNLDAFMFGRYSRLRTPDSYQLTHAAFAMLITIKHNKSFPAFQSEELTHLLFACSCVRATWQHLSVNWARWSIISWSYPAGCHRPVDAIIISSWVYVVCRISLVAACSFDLILFLSFSFSPRPAGDNNAKRGTSCHQSTTPTGSYRCRYNDSPLCVRTLLSPWCEGSQFSVLNKPVLLFCSWKVLSNKVFFVMFATFGDE